MYVMNQNIHFGWKHFDEPTRDYEIITRNTSMTHRSVSSNERVSNKQVVVKRLGFFRDLIKKEKNL